MVSSARPSLLLAAAAASHPIRSPLLLQRAFATTRPSLSSSSDSNSSSSNPASPAANLSRIRSAIGSGENDPALLKADPRPPRPPPPTSENIKGSTAKRFAGDLRSINKGEMQQWTPDEFFDDYKNDLRKEIKLRLTPQLGRTINTNRTTTPARAIARLDALVRRNQVRAELRRQKFHERPALRRKRQWRERANDRFRGGVRAVISRTMELRQMGW